MNFITLNWGEGIRRYHFDCV